MQSSWARRTSCAFLADGGSLTSSLLQQWPLLTQSSWAPSGSPSLAARFQLPKSGSPGLAPPQQHEEGLGHPCPIESKQKHLSQCTNRNPQITQHHLVAGGLQAYETEDCGFQVPSLPLDYIYCCPVPIDGRDLLNPTHLFVPRGPSQENSQPLAVPLLCCVFGGNTLR